MDGEVPSRGSAKGATLGLEWARSSCCIRQLPGRTPSSHLSPGLCRLSPESNFRSHCVVSVRGVSALKAFPGRPCRLAGSSINPTSQQQAKGHDEVLLQAQTRTQRTKEEVRSFQRAPIPGEQPASHLSTTTTTSIPKTPLHPVHPTGPQHGCWAGQTTCPPDCSPNFHTGLPALPILLPPALRFYLTLPPLLGRCSEYLYLL